MRGWARGLAVLCCLALLGMAARPAGAKGEIILGAPTSLTTLEGAESLRAVRLAVEEINAAGGVRVGQVRRKLVVEPFDLKDVDAADPPTQAVARLRAFIEQKRPQAILIGPFRSEVLLASLDLLAEEKIPTLVSIAMSPAVDAKILSDPKYKLIFRVGLNARYLVDYLIEAMKLINRGYGFHKVFILNQDVAWARSTASLMIKLYFDRAGWQVLGQENVAEETTDFAPALERVKAQGAQVILALFDMPSSGGLVGQWHEIKPPAMLCGYISAASGPGAWNAYGGRLAGLLNVIFELGNLPSAKYRPAADFYRLYQARYGQPIQSGHGPAPSYESVHILAQAWERAGSLDRERVTAALEATDRQGAMGRLRFHRGHQVIFGGDPANDALACVAQWSAAGRRVIVYPQAVAEGGILLPPFVTPTP